MRAAPSPIVRRHPVANAFFGFCSFALPLVITFLTLPWYLRFLGTDHYGLYLFLLTLVNVVSIVDLGLSYEWSYHLARYDPQNDRETSRMAGLFSATCTMYVIAAVVAALLVVGVYGALVMFGGMRSVIRDASWGLVGLTAALTAIRMMSVPLSVSITALQRFDVGATISLSALVVGQGAGLITVALGGGVVGLMAVQVAVYAVLAAAWYASVRFFIPAIRYGRPTQKECTTIVYSGLWVALQNASQTILTQLDKLVLGVTHGTSAVTVYANAQLLPEKMVGTVNSIGGVLFPFFSRASAERHHDIRSLSMRTVRLSTALIVFITVGLVVYGPPFIRLWLGDDLARQSISVFFVLVVTYALLAWYSLVINMMFGMRETKRLSYYSLTLSVINVVALLILIPRFGVMGAGIAYALAVVPVPWFLLSLVRHMGVTDTTRSLLGGACRQLAKSCAAAILTIACSYGVFTVCGKGWGGLLLAVLTSGAGYVFVVYRFSVISVEDRQPFIAAFTRVAQRWRSVVK